MRDINVHGSTRYGYRDQERRSALVYRSDLSLRIKAVLLVGLLLLSPPAWSQEQDLESLIFGALEKHLKDKFGAGDEPAPHSAPLVFKDKPESNFEEFKSLHVNSNSSSTVTQSSGGVEQECYDLVQDRIAWNTQGNRRWTASSVKTLCRGTTVATAPPRCFDRALHAPQVWRTSANQTLNWSLASALCAGTSDANRTLNCFKQRMRASNDINGGIKFCSKSGSSATVPWGGVVLQPTTVLTPVATVETKPKKEKECFDHVQNNIAWDAAKQNKKWADRNIRRLCKGATSKYSPGNCFDYVMHRGSQWGRKSKHKMTWSIALDACEGTSSAKATTNCFKRAIADNLTTSAAAKKCDVR